MRIALIRIPDEYNSICWRFFLLRAVMRIRRLPGIDRVVIGGSLEKQDCIDEILSLLPLTWKWDNKSYLCEDIPPVWGKGAGFAELIGDNMKLHFLTVPQKFKLIDCHVHTPLAYCQENLNTPAIFAMAEASGISKFAFTEHSGQLYLNKEDFKRAAYYPSGLRACHLHSRMEAYKCFLANCPEEKFIRGMEFDCDSSGKLIRMEQDIANIDLKLGAVHYLIGDTAKQASSEFMHITERLILSGIDILAHPFRIFQRRYLPEPTYLYEDIASLLAESQVAVELNFHTNRPEAEFFNVCLARGVKIALGSDAHNLYEVGDLRPHLEFLNTLSSTNVMEQLWHPNGRR